MKKNKEKKLKKNKKHFIKWVHMSITLSKFNTVPGGTS